MLIDFANDSLLFRLHDSLEYDQYTLPLLTAIEIFLDCNDNTRVMKEIIAKSSELLIGKNYLLMDYTFDIINYIVKKYYEYRSSLLHGRPFEIKPMALSDWEQLFKYICDLTISRMKEL